MRLLALTRTLATLAAVSMAVVACSGKDDKAAGNGDTDDSGDDTDVVDDSVAPVITSVDAVDCSMQQSAGEIWQLEITVTDPQGIDSVAGGTVSVLNAEGGELANYSLACNEGSCIGSFRADYDGIACSMDGDIALSFIVQDEDGNASEAKVYEPAGG